MCFNYYFFNTIVIFQIIELIIAFNCGKHKWCQKIHLDNSEVKNYVDFIMKKMYQRTKIEIEVDIVGPDHTYLLPYC